MFRWRADNLLTGVRKGEIAGKVAKSGYRSVTLDGRHYVMHRLAFLYMTGREPSGLIDHANMIRRDNRWENLREANWSQNRANTRVRVDCRAGVKGVIQVPSGRYRAQIRAHGRQIHIGTYDTITEASDAYQQAAKHHFGEFARAS